MIGFAIKSTAYQMLKTKLPLIAIMGMCVLFGSCSINSRISRDVKKVFAKSGVLKQYHVGFALYDMASQRMLFETNADKYFTPASNTKLFTFYAGLKMIPDSIPSLRYIERGDSLIFWGTGDPSFLQTSLKGVKALEILKATNKKLFFAPGRYTDGFYGRGWQWDDYNDYYQAEINEMPLMDNTINITVKDDKMVIAPKLFEACFLPDTGSLEKTFKVTRNFNTNQFSYPQTSIPANYSQQIPYKLSLSATLSLLSDTLKKTVAVINLKMPADAKTIYNLKTDSVLKAMMLPSDNFIAEQLLLVYSNQLGEMLSTSKAISYIEKNYLSSLPDKPQWVDGSGLSRGNLFTPRDIVKLLELIYKEVNDPQKLYGMLPAGGNRGTLKNTYPKTDRPFVFGKTGSLSNNHNQSGYVVTKKGRTYIFSFMNNNFVLPASDVRKEMVRIMTHIHEKF